MILCQSWVKTPQSKAAHKRTHSKTQARHRACKLGDTVVIEALLEPPAHLFSNAKIFFQSFFILMTIVLLRPRYRAASHAQHVAGDKLTALAEGGNIPP